MIRLPEDSDPQATLLPDLTPLLDVIFIVIVFLMFTANVAPLALPVDLPKQGADQAGAIKQEQPLSINLLSASPGWALDGQEYSSWETVRMELLKARAAQPDIGVVIAGDRSVPMERLVLVLSFLQSQNWPAASIMMESER